MGNLQWLLLAFAMCLGLERQVAASAEAMEPAVARSIAAGESGLYVQTDEGMDLVHHSRPLPRPATPTVQSHPKRFVRVLKRQSLPVCGFTAYARQPCVKNEMTGDTLPSFSGSAVERCVFFCRFLL